MPTEVKPICGHTICQLIGMEYRIYGNPYKLVYYVSSLSGAVEEGTLSFCSSIEDIDSKLVSSKADTIFVSSKIDPVFFAKAVLSNKTIIGVNNPRLAFIKILNKLINKPKDFKNSPIIGKNASIGDCCSISNGVIIGNNVILGRNVVIYGGCKIGDNVHIWDNCVIGADGFGYERNDGGELEKFTHLGGVIIGNNVEIHPLTNIASGVLDDTIIGDGTKIDSLCHIAHNVHIGKNCLIIAHSEISGGVEIGDNVWVSPNVCTRDRIKIGSWSTLGLGSVVTKDVPKNTTVIGSPARPEKEFKKLAGKWSRDSREDHLEKFHRTAR